jgi:hypothetical protein
MWSSPTRSTSPWNNIPFNRKKKNINRHTTPPTPHAYTFTNNLREKKERRRRIILQKNHTTHHKKKEKNTLS